MPYWILGGFAIWLLLVGYIGVAGYVLTRKRQPDPPDNPKHHNLPYEDVTFASRYKVQLKGWWIPVDHPKGTVIFCHGQNGSMEGDLAQAVPLHQASYNVLMFNLRAHGTSEGSKVTYGVFEKEDLLGAIDYLSQAKSIQKVALMGFSMGAAVVLISAALTDKVDTIILDGIFYRFVDVVNAKLRSRYIPPILSTLMAQAAVLGASLTTNTRMYQVSPKLWALHLDESISVLFIHGEKDHLIPPMAVQQLAADLKGQSEIWIAPECDHRQAFHKLPTDYNRRVIAWLEAHHGQG